VFNPILRFLFEKPMHRYISKDNDRMIKDAIEQFVSASRARNA
ncbi:MAG TPA: polyketide cyclase / dehydrase and lipid transport family protein, partial [Erythrobacter sp.]|nr:polyketide cyclase / dehydrase and lipid transport family protein [Erythrobacter sp.]